MEEHEVSIVNVREYNVFKKLEIEYLSTYYYCEKCDEYFTDEYMITNNDISMKDAYRKKVGLLTS